MIQLIDGGPERAARGECADVKFVDDRFLPGTAPPFAVAPEVGFGLGPCTSFGWWREAGSGTANPSGSMNR
jgi:hypothetical protein